MRTHKHTHERPHAGHKEKVLSKELKKQLAPVKKSLKKIEKTGDRIMAAIPALDDKIAELVTSFAANQTEVLAAFDRLAALIGTGTPDVSAQVQALADLKTAIDAGTETAKTKGV